MFAAPAPSTTTSESSAAAGGQLSADVDVRLLADSIPHLVWVCRPDGSLEYLNRRTAEYTGRCPELAEKWEAVVHPDDQEAVRRSLHDVVRAQSPDELNARIRAADGQYRWHCLHTVPMRRPNGDIVKWIGTATDIHEQKALQESLRRCEQQAAETLSLLETVQAAAPVGLGFVDPELHLVRVDETLATITGVAAHDSTGSTLAETFPHVSAHFEAGCRQVLVSGEAVLNVEVPGWSLDSPDRPQSWITSYYPVRADSGIVGVGLIVVDLTQRDSAEAFRSVVMENMAEGLYTVDGQGLLTSMNRAAATMLGWQEDELRGRSMHDTVHFQRAGGLPNPETECPVSTVRTSGTPVRNTEETFTRKDGTTFPVTYSAAPLAVESQNEGVVVVFRDASDLRHQRQQEVEDRHDQKLESLGRLSAGIAHEINTPIQFVGDNTRFLASAYQDMLELLLVYRGCLDSSAGQLPWQERAKRVSDAETKADIDYLAEEVPVAVEQSLEGIERVASLVRAMKAFSYKDANNHSYADLNAALTTTLTVARNEVKYVADVDLELGEIPEVLCCVGDLNQVFLNLLVNAADALQERGERGEIKITTRVEGTLVAISIADNGPGIPEHLQQLVFDPFFTTKEVGKGTGQGLALARAVIDKHGGSIEVFSTPEKGTEFILRLPVDGKRPGPA